MHHDHSHTTLRDLRQSLHRRHSLRAVGGSMGLWIVYYRTGSGGAGRTTVAGEQETLDVVRRVTLASTRRESLPSNNYDRVVYKLAPGGVSTVAAGGVYPGASRSTRPETCISSTTPPIRREPHFIQADGLQWLIGRLPPNAHGHRGSRASILNRKCRHGCRRQSLYWGLRRPQGGSSGTITTVAQLTGRRSGGYLGQRLHRRRRVARLGGDPAGTARC